MGLPIGSVNNSRDIHRLNSMVSRLLVECRSLFCQ